MSSDQCSVSVDLTSQKRFLRFLVAFLYLQMRETARDMQVPNSTRVFGLKWSVESEIRHELTVAVKIKQSSSCIYAVEGLINIGVRGTAEGGPSPSLLMLKDRWEYIEVCLSMDFGGMGGAKGGMSVMTLRNEDGRELYSETGDEEPDLSDERSGVAMAVLKNVGEKGSEIIDGDILPDDTDSLARLKGMNLEAHDLDDLDEAGRAVAEPLFRILKNFIFKSPTLSQAYISLVSNYS
jgi:hypothetical protein